MVKDWCNKGSIWDNTLTTMKRMKKPSIKENDDLITSMLGVGIDAPSAPEPTETRLGKEAVDECISAVNVTLVKTVVTQHMAMPKTFVEGKDITSTYVPHA
jgi:hypothetical protein